MAETLEQLALEPGMRVLEIGAGSGYKAAAIAPWRTVSFAGAGDPEKSGGAVNPSSQHLMGSRDGGVFKDGRRLAGMPKSGLGRSDRGGRELYLTYPRWLWPDGEWRPDGVGVIINLDDVHHITLDDSPT